MVYLLLALLFFFLPYPLVWSGYIKTVNYKKPTMPEKLCHIAGFIFMNFVMIEIMGLVPLLFIYIFFSIMLGIGAIFSLPLALPFIRRRAKSNLLFRRLAIVFCTLLALMSYTGLFSYAFASSAANNNLEDGVVNLPYQYHDEYKTEFEMRSMLAPIAAEHCFTGNSELCAIIDKSPYSNSQIWFNFIITIIFSVLPALGAWIFGNALTRPDAKPEPVKLLVG